jgi:hypothetical protein
MGTWLMVLVGSNALRSAYELLRIYQCKVREIHDKYTLIATLGMYAMAYANKLQVSKCPLCGPVSEKWVTSLRLIVQW